MSPEEWALKFGEMLDRHQEEISLLDAQMNSEIGWCLEEGHDREYAIQKWIDGRKHMIYIY